MARWFWLTVCVLIGACGGPEGGGAETSSGPPSVPDAATAAEVSAPETSVEAQAPTVTVSADLKRKLVELAVASECARREAVPADQAIPRLEALFAAQGVTLAEYSDAMAQLVSDNELHAAITSRLASCGALVEALWPKSAQADAGDAGSAASDTGPDVLAQDVDAGPTVDAGASDTSAPTSEDVKVTPDVAVADVAVADVAEPPRPAPSWSGTWVGALKGQQSGNLRVTVAGGRVTAAVATFGRSTIRLKGSLSDKGSLSLGGTAGDEFLRLTGRVDRAGQLITGTWDGVIARKRSSGSLRLSR